MKQCERIFYLCPWLDSGAFWMPSPPEVWRRGFALPTAFCILLSLELNIVVGYVRLLDGLCGVLALGAYMYALLGSHD
jgi:ABC-type branched-subunit amino acid transport system permease subunit